MILTLAIVLGLLASLACYRGRTFRRIAAMPLHSAWLVMLALAMQWPLLHTPAGPTQAVRWQQFLFLLSHLLLLVFVWRNRRSIGIVIAGLGVLCNLAVIVANGGFMPITPEACVQINAGSVPDQWVVGSHYGHSKDVILVQGETKLWILSDILVLPPPFPWPAAFSLGDVLIAVGIGVLLLILPQPKSGTASPQPLKNRVEA